MTEIEYRNRLNQEVTRRSHMQRELEKALEENRLLRKQIFSLKQENKKLHEETLKYITSLKETEDSFQERIGRLESENERLQDLLEESGYGKRNSE